MLQVLSSGQNSSPCFSEVPLPVNKRSQSEKQLSATVDRVYESNRDYTDLRKRRQQRKNFEENTLAEQCPAVGGLTRNSARGGYSLCFDSASGVLLRLYK